MRLSKLNACLLACALWQALVFLPATNARAQVAGSTGAAQPYFSEPAISPDRAEIAFVSGGDIWTVPASGGQAQLLVSHPATESRPVYSPDGRRLAFTSNRTGNGDIYVLTIDTGDLRRLTFDDNFELIDAWSRDGRWLYFSATARDIGAMNDIYRVGAEGGTPMLFAADRYTNEYFSAPSPDGAQLAITARGIVSQQWWRKGSSHIDQSEIWLVREGSPGGAPTYLPVTRGGARDAWPMWGAQGRSLYFVSDRGGAQNIWAQAFGVAGEPRQLTKFRDGRVLWPSISYDGRTIVFERDFKIWKLDTEGGGQPTEVRVTRRGASAAPGVERQRLGGAEQIQELALSPDGKKVAFVWRGEVFAASSADGGDAARVTTTAAPESQVVWAPDSRRLAYVSDRGGSSQIFSYDFANNRETQLTSTTSNDSTPRFSPDGKLLAFERDGRELRVLTVETRQERVVAAASLERPPLNSDRPYVWSPDGRWLAFMPVTNQRLFRNVFIVAADGGAQAQPVSFLANSFGNTVSWSPDGTFLLFDTGQRTETFQVARVDLIPRTPRFREDQFRDLFREEPPRTVAPTLRREERPAPSPEPAQPSATPAATPSPTSTPNTTPTPAATPTPAPSNPAPTEGSTTGGSAADRMRVKPVEVVFEGIRRRLSTIPVGVDVAYQAISPDGKWLVLIAAAENQQNLYLHSLDELAPNAGTTRQLTSTSGPKSFAQFSPDNREVYYLEGGRIQITPLEQGRPTRTLAVTAEMDVDFSREKLEVFEQGWAYMRDNFYDPKFHGVDWQSVRAQYEPHVAGARTPDEMRRVMQLMVGELNASHLGINAPASATQVTTGRLGLRFDRGEYERAGRLRVSEVLPLSPAAVARDTGRDERMRGVREGEYLLAVDGREVDARTNLDELLNYKIGRRVVLTLSSSPAGADRREAAVRPSNLATEKALLYRKWVEDKRAYVARVSQGRLGYVHMFDMSSSSLTQLHVDLDAENQSREGVVIDVRHNNGGFVNVYAIDVLSRRSYLQMTPRGFATAPARSVLGQRALELPTVLVTNQHSLSDAEDFSEGYRTLGLGKVVGEPTAGWIIYTWNISLMDGSVFRLPRMKVTDSAGRVMELNPRPVDIPVKRPVGEHYTGRDTQLDAAARELLRQIDARRQPAVSEDK